MAWKMTQEVYDKIVHLHKDCGWSVRQLEARFGIPKTTIHRIIKQEKPYEIIDTDNGK